MLKDHTLAEVTLIMKNMIDLAPTDHYHQGGWQKAAFHSRMHEAIADLNRYRCFNFTILDATSGMAVAHLVGATCNLPVNKLAAGYAPWLQTAMAPGCSERTGEKLVTLQWLTESWNRLSRLKVKSMLASFSYCTLLLKINFRFYSPWPHWIHPAGVDLHD